MRRILTLPGIAVVLWIAWWLTVGDTNAGDRNLLAPPVDVIAGPPVNAGDTEAVEFEIRGTPDTPIDPRRLLADLRRAGPGDRARVRRLALTSTDPLVAGNALRALGRLGAITGDHAVLKLAEDPRPRVRHDLVMAIGLDGDPTLLPIVFACVADDDKTLRALAIQALGRLGGDAARRRLTAIAADPEREKLDRTFAKAALRGD